MRLSAEALEVATAGCWHGTLPGDISLLTTDTRDFEEGATFLALRGPNHDGHCHAVSIADQAAALIGDSAGVALWRALPTSYLEVEDTLQAFGDIAHAWRQKLEHTTVIAIGGSYGKTSMRSLLEHAFQGLGLKVAATEGNLNNLIGVPKTLLGVPVDADIALIECGISEMGEMQRLSEIVEPDMALFTGIAHAHTEGLGGIDGVVREKSALFQGLRRGGTAVLGEGVVAGFQQAGVQLPVDRVEAESEQAVGWNLKGDLLTLTSGAITSTMRLSLPAPHWAANMALAATFILHCRGDVSLEDIVAAFRTWNPPAGRLRTVRGRCTILDDCYNANPASMQAGLDTLRALSGRKIAILGDMAELGDDAKRLHSALDISGIDEVYLIGSMMHALADHVSVTAWFPSLDLALPVLQKVVFHVDDNVLVKGSRAMRMDRVVALLQEEVADVL